MQIKFCHVEQKSAPHGDSRAVPSLWTMFFSPQRDCAKCSWYPQCTEFSASPLVADAGCCGILGRQKCSIHRSHPSQSKAARLLQCSLPMTLEGGDLAEVNIRSQHMVHFLVGLQEVKRTKFHLFLSAVYKNTKTFWGNNIPLVWVRADIHHSDSFTRHLTSKEQ